MKFNCKHNMKMKKLKFLIKILTHFKKYQKILIKQKMLLKDKKYI